MLACSALVACTNEDVLENIDNPVVKGDKAYVMVNIKSANGLSSRGTGVDEKENPIFQMASMKTKLAVLPSSSMMQMENM